MKKRIFAWVLLAGFVLLLLNLIVFRIYWQVSMVAYIIIFLGFVFTGGKLFGSDKNYDYESDASDKSAENDEDGNESESENNIENDTDDKKNDG